jgi:Zn-dependent protease
VFLNEPEHTAYDLRFRLFGTSARVHPLFWLVTLIMGWPESGDPHGMRDLVIWTACVFVSILLHEFGHVWMGRWFRSPGYIVLYSLGGLAIGASDVRGRWRRILVSFAGPAAGFVLFGVVAVGVFVAAQRAAGPILGDRSVIGLLLSLEEVSILGRLMMLVSLAGLPEGLHTACWYLFWINLIWGLVNLLPVWPLDGGKISREICEWFSPINGRRASLGISIAAAALFAAQSLAAHVGKPLIPYLPAGGLFSALFFAALAYGSYLELQATPQRRSFDRDRDDDWARPADWWKGGRR